MSHRTLNIAHQGASGHYPSNTLASFRGAVEAHADIIELDVTITSDGAVVVSHDLTVDRHTDGHGLIPEMTLTQVKALDAGVRFGAKFAGERIPTLEETIDWAEKNPIRLCIEVKGDTEEHYLQAGRSTIDILKRRNYLPKATLTSFSPKCISEMRLHEPRLAWGYDPDERHVYEPWEVCAESLSCGATFLLYDHRQLTKQIVDEAHQHGFAVWAWTANTAEHMTRALDMGVDALMTNYPEVLGEVLEAR